MQKGRSEKLWKDFGAWVRDQRETRHLSQQGAADRAGIDRQQWYRIESGKSGTKRDTVIAIANALSVAVPEALRRAGFGDPEAEFSDAGFFKGLEKLSPEHQAAVKRAVRAMIDTLAADDNPDTDYISDEDDSP